MPRLAPEERRAALIAATLPLLRAHGLDVSTRQIAEAAGVAEGTIFRVFPDKQALICAAVAHAFDPTPVVSALRAMPAHLDLRAKLLVIARMLSRRFEENFPLMVALRTSPRMPDIGQPMTRILAAVEQALAPDKADLRYPPETVAWLLWSLILMQKRAPGKPLAAKDIVSVLLDGVVRPERQPTESPCS